jgi:rubrerythrin
VRDGLRKVLELAVAREQEAAAFYKEWARVAESEAVRVLFGDLGAAEHDHGQMLAHVIPADVFPRSRGALPDVAVSEYLAAIHAGPGMSFAEALDVAVKREESAARLYDRLAELGGEAAQLFRSLAKEERSHREKLQTMCGGTLPGPARHVGNLGGDGV